MEITKIYFEDLKLILNHIHEYAPEPHLTFEKNLISNKATYMYNLLPPADSQEKREKHIHTELTHFLNRLYYDKTRLKVVFSEISPKYIKIRAADKLGADLTMLNSGSSDVGIFL